MPVNKCTYLTNMHKMQTYYYGIVTRGDHKMHCTLPICPSPAKLHSNKSFSKHKIDRTVACITYGLVPKSMLKGEDNKEWNTNLKLGRVWHT